MLTGPPQLETMMQFPNVSTVFLLAHFARGIDLIISLEVKIKRTVCFLFNEKLAATSREEPLLTMVCEGASPRHI